MAVYPSVPIMVAGLPLSADAYMANREWGSLMIMSLSAYMGGLKRDGLSADTIFSFYYSLLTAPASRTSFP